MIQRRRQRAEHRMRTDVEALQQFLMTWAGSDPSSDAGECLVAQGEHAAAVTGRLASGERGVHGFRERLAADGATLLLSGVHQRAHRSFRHCLRVHYGVGTAALFLLERRRTSVAIAEARASPAVDGDVHLAQRRDRLAARLTHCSVDRLALECQGRGVQLDQCLDRLVGPTTRRRGVDGTREVGAELRDVQQPITRSFLWGRQAAQRLDHLRWHAPLRGEQHGHMLERKAEVCRLAAIRCSIGHPAGRCPHVVLRASVTRRHHLTEVAEQSAEIGQLGSSVAGLHRERQPLVGGQYGHDQQILHGCRIALEPVEDRR